MSIQNKIDLFTSPHGQAAGSYFNKELHIGNYKDWSTRTQQVCDALQGCLNQIESNPEELSLNERIELLEKLNPGIERFIERVETAKTNRWWYPTVNYYFGYKVDLSHIELVLQNSKDLCERLQNPHRGYSTKNALKH